jgi:hypothetical protein
MFAFMVQDSRPRLGLESSPASVSSPYVAQLDLAQRATWPGERDHEGAPPRHSGLMSGPAMVCGWTIERALGAGPVCESWLGSRASALAVVRVLRERFAADEHASAEWVRASWSANRFQHARVVGVIEQGVIERGAGERGVPVIVRGWAPGESLDQAIQRGVVDPALALRIAEQVLDALEMAHAHGIHHGALAPSNIILSPHRSARLVDFGHRGEDAIASARVSPFSAPERRASPAAPPSETADVWSVGACLRFAIGSGRADPDVAAMIHVATAVDPRERYESAYAMLGDVRRVLAGRRPKLRGALAPVPSQSVARPPLGDLTVPPSSSGLRGPAAQVFALAEAGASPPEAAGKAAAADASAKAATQGREWRGNVLLIAAIALIVGLATFVLVRERLADPSHGPAAEPQVSEAR